MKDRNIDKWLLFIFLLVVAPCKQLWTAAAAVDSGAVAAATSAAASVTWPSAGALATGGTTPESAATTSSSSSSSDEFRGDGDDDRRGRQYLRSPLFLKSGPEPSFTNGSGGVPSRAKPQRTAPLEGRLLQTEAECSVDCCASAHDMILSSEVEECDDGGANPLAGVPFLIQMVLIVVLICLSALFSGLTLGLMGLDCTGLEIVMSGDDERNARNAAKIYPLRKNGNLLLCTLLLGNVAVNALLSILLADKAGGLVGLLASTFLIVIFGEIVPQALCNRYALEIGSVVVPLVRAIIVVLYVAAAPLGWALDKALGKELATTYSNAEMLKLLQIHVQEEKLDKDTAMTMTGALKYKDTPVKDVMTHLDKVFMLSVTEKLNFETIAKIFKTGYSRIPVYEINKNNVIGLLFVKDLIFIDPEDETRISDFIEIFGRGVHVVWPDDPLGDVLRELKRGKSHMALVRDVNNEDETQDPFYEIRGIITLEDIIEVILGEEIVDETDAFIDGSHSKRVDRAETFKWARLRLLDSKIVDEKLSHDEVMAVSAHLLKNYPSVVSLVTENQLVRLLSECPVTLLPTAEQDIGCELPNDLLYQQDQPSDSCMLILAGKVTVLAGADKFRSDVSSWALLGAGALSDPNYAPDFTAWVSAGPCRCIRITRASFTAVVDSSARERHSNHGFVIGTGSLYEQLAAGDMRGENLDGSSSKLLPVPISTLRNNTQQSEKFEDCAPNDVANEGKRRKKLMTALRMYRKDDRRSKSDRPPSSPSPNDGGNDLSPSSRVRFSVSERLPKKSSVNGPPLEDDELADTEPAASLSRGAESPSRAISSDDGLGNNGMVTNSDSQEPLKGSSMQKDVSNGAGGATQK